MKRRRIAPSLGFVMLTGWAAVAAIDEALLLPNDHPAIQYIQQPPKDPVAQRRVQNLAEFLQARS